MENSSHYENYDLGYQPSPSSIDQNDHSTTETLVYSTMSGDSFAWTYSEISTLSDPVDDNSCSSEPSPSNWPTAKSGQTVLSRSGMKQQKTPIDGKLDDQDAGELGESVLQKFHFTCMTLKAV